jgi:hypothetical protein
MPLSPLTCLKRRIDSIPELEDISSPKSNVPETQKHVPTIIPASFATTYIELGRRSSSSFVSNMTKTCPLHTINSDTRRLTQKEGS